MERQVAPHVSAAVPKARVTLWAGAAIILVCEALLFTDVALSHRGAIHSNYEYVNLPLPSGLLTKSARWVAANMTPLAWSGLLLLLDGVLACRPGGSPARRRPHHFWLLFIASIFIWCVFDLINFWVFAPHHAWRYVGMPPAFADRLWGYILAFGAVVPGMLLIGQLYLSLGLFDWASIRPLSPSPGTPGEGRGGGIAVSDKDPHPNPLPEYRGRGQRRARRMPRWLVLVAFLAGVAMLAWPLLSRRQVTNYTLWTSLVFLLDPINLWLGRPSMLRDWENGWFGRTLAAFAGGLTCGLLWEFWNYWALAKWVYDLPFLGALERYKYFEMPLPGLLGFIPFGIECWVMWQMMRIALDGLAEPLPDQRTLV
jgi:hypothetical protein